MFDELFLDSILRLLLAAGVGILAGIERDLTARPTGMRTSMLICLGACLFTLLSIHGFPETQGFDPSRVASYVVAGIGFLGGGVMIQRESKVLGLTSAAEVWLLAAIGMAIATDLLWLGVGAGLVVIPLLMILAPMSQKLSEIGEARMRRKGVEPVGD